MRRQLPEYADPVERGLRNVKGWEFWIDRGGTFTDVVARTPSGALQSLKLLSAKPGSYADAAVEGIRRLLAAAPDQQRTISAVKIGTTVATNALLERRGEPTVLVITAGLRDAIRIGGQQRPDIFALAIDLPEMLYSRVIEAEERIGAHGEILRPLNSDRLHADLRAAHSEGFRSAAIVLLHAFGHPAHEIAAASIAREIGFQQISVSHQVSPLMKLVLRGETTLVDAYLSPVIDRYIASVRGGLASDLLDAPLAFMQSNGGLARAAQFRGKDSLLSGPAGGVIGMARVARELGFDEVIGFDMGGTSTDVSLYAGALERNVDAVIAGVRVSAPMLRIETVAAGGGSILKFADGRLQVGPGSAGADPGPACYGNGGPLALTDANVLLGRILPDFFPHVFGKDGMQPLDTDASAAAFASLSTAMTDATGRVFAPEEVAAGSLQIAVERMANAIKRISVQRGHDATQFALCCFGGAAGQHACLVAEVLGIRTILIHPLAGVLSAYGIGIADLRTVQRRTIEIELDSAFATLGVVADALAKTAQATLMAQGAPRTEIAIERRLALKTAGSDTALTVVWPEGALAGELRAVFDAAHLRHYGFHEAHSDVVVEAVEIEGVAPSGSAMRTGPAPGAREVLATDSPPAAAATRPMWSRGAWLRVPIYVRSQLLAGQSLRGPAIITEPNTTTVLEPDWLATVHSSEALLLTRTAPDADPSLDETADRAAKRPDPVLLEVFNHLFMHVAEQMGGVLERTAHSVNIKERLDFSCAVFDEHGQLVANAPHIPVHLGSMGDSVQAILRTQPLEPGDSYLTNSPYHGGTHLPDVTVVTPVFGNDRELRYVVASRAHHADIGGITPGSMPPNSVRIEQEGVLLDSLPLVQRGRFREAEIRRLLAGHVHPARNPDQNIADLKAQLAANARGVAELDRLVDRFGLRTVRCYMRHVQANAEECVRTAIAGLRDGRFEVELDTGDRIAVAIEIDRKRRVAALDFTGTSPQSHGNFNAPASIVRAAVLYVFRTLVRENIPLNAGCLKPLEIVLPERCLLNPVYPAAVVAGNVETSQCITDALLAALDVCAAAQGTMNNFTFGNATHQYYETICGGAGAGPEFDGASAVHTHMTNSRLTDPEVLEWRYPVRVRRFEIRRGSGGAGRHHGGDGVRRDIEFLEPMHVAILSNRRRVAPFALHGGSAGACGKNYVIRANGAVEDVPATAVRELAAGDRFVIETPGGGGFG